MHSNGVSLRAALVALLTFSSLAAAQKPAPCETPRVRDTAALTAAIAQDKAMAQVFLKASQACQMAQSDACDAARLECGTQLAQTLKAQVGFDDGAWLRDMLLPYGGFYYPPTRQFQPGAMALDTACNGDTNQLMAASSRRSLQSARRQAILEEYPRYVAWVQDQAKACRERTNTEDAKRSLERQEAEKLAAAALAAKTAEELRQKTEADTKARAEDEAKKAAEAQKRAEEQAQRQAKEALEQKEREKKEAEARAKDEKETAEEKAKEEREAAEKRAKDAQEAQEKKEADARERAEKEKQAEKDEREAQERKAKDDAAREKAEAERKAREAEEARLVKAREDRKLELRTQKDKLNAQALAAEQRAAEIAAMTFTAEQAQQAAQLSQERAQAVERAKVLRAQAAEIVIDADDERGRGSVGILAGAGAANWTGSSTAIIGAQALFHIGFWGVAPSEGLASGFEVRALARFLAAIGAISVPQAEVIGTARYFFGRFAVGGAIEFRWNQPVAAPGSVNLGFGPSLGFAFVDTPRTRVLLSGSWLPLTQQGFQNPYRATGDLEVSHDFLTFSISGGSQVQPVDLNQVGTIVGWYVGAFGGVRFRW